MENQPLIDVKPDNVAKCCAEMARLDKGDENTRWGQRNSSGPCIVLDTGVGILDGSSDQPGRVR